MNDEEETLMALEDELRALAACDREGAAAGADLQAQVKRAIDAEAGRVWRRRMLYRVGTAAASLVLLAGAGALLLHDEVRMAMGDESGATKQMVTDDTPAQKEPQSTVPTSFTLAPAVAAGGDGNTWSAETVPDARPATLSEDVRPESVPVDSLPTPVSGSTVAVNSPAVVMSAPIPQGRAAKRKRSAPPTPAALADVLARQPQPWQQLRAMFMQPGCPQQVEFAGGLSVAFSDRVVTVTIAQGDTTATYRLSAPADTLPADVRKRFEFAH